MGGYNFELSPPSLAPPKENFGIGVLDIVAEMLVLLYVSVYSR